MHSVPSTQEPGRANYRLVGPNFVDDVNIPGFVDDALLDDSADNDTVKTTVHSTVRRTDSPSPAAATVAMPDFDGAVISVFAVAVILLVVGQTVVVCRQRHRRSCHRRCRKWNVPVFDHMNGLTAARPALHSQRPSEVWTALPSSPLSDPFHTDHYRTAAFAYINRRSADSLHVPSRSGSSASSTAAIFARASSSAVTWSDVGEMTSSSPDKRPTTSLSLSSSEGGGERGAARLDAEAQTNDGQAATTAASHPPSPADDDDVNVTSSASIDCSPTHSLRSACDDEVDITLCHSRRRGPYGCFDHSEPASPTTMSTSSTNVVEYVELATDCSSTTHNPDTDNSIC